MLHDHFLAMAIIWYGVLVFSLVLHEAAHAWAAYWLGDPTGYLNGQVTLDPTPHLRQAPVGTIAIPLVSFITSGGHSMFGWANTPYNPEWAYRKPRAAALMALAGPVSNILMAIACGVLIKIGLWTGWFLRPDLPSLDQWVVANDQAWQRALGVLVSIAFSLNLVLAIFNLLPLPPLDGATIITLAFDQPTARWWQVRLQGPFERLIGILLAVFLVIPVIMPYVFSVAWTIIYP